MKPGTPIVPLLMLFNSICPKAFSQTASGVINAYYQVTSVNSVANSVTVDNASGLTPGERILIIQHKGASITSTNTSGFGDITAINSAGNYEFNTVCNIIANQVWLVDALLNTYNPAGQVQLVAIPSYKSVTVVATVNGLAWDPVTGKGGIVAIEAADTIFLNAD